MSKRSGIPVVSKTRIPVARNSANTTTPSIAQSTNGNVSRFEPRESDMAGKKAPASKPSSAVRRKSNAEYPKDPKLLKDMIVNLQKQLQEKDQTLIEMNQKLAVKSEECDNLMEERDMLRSKNTFDLQQVTEDYATIQHQLKAKEHYIQEVENAHAEEKVELRLELEIVRSEHQLEVEFLKKELEAAKEKQNGNKDYNSIAEKSDLNESQEWFRDDTDFAAQQNKYEEEIRLLKKQLQEQIAIANETVEKLEQQEFNFHEEMNAYKNKLELEKEAVINESRQNVEVLRGSYEEKLQLQEEKYSEEINCLKGSQENKIIDKDDESTETEIKQKMSTQYDALKSEHENYVAALKEEYEDEMRTMKLQIQQREAECNEKESRMAEDIVKLHNEFEKQFEESNKIFENELEEKQEALRQLQRKVSELEQELVTNRDELRRKEVRKDQELMTQLNENICELEDLRTENEKYKREIFELKAQLQREQSLFEEERNKEANVHLNKIEELKEQHGKEIQGLQDILENLQEKNNELKTEFDLVVGDLSSELEDQRLKIPHAKRKNSSVLMEQIDKLRKDYQRETRLLSEELEEITSKNEELESELQILRTGKDHFTTSPEHENSEDNMSHFQNEKKEFEKTKKNLEEMEEKVKSLEKERCHLETTITQLQERLNKSETLETQLRSKLESAETYLINKQKQLSLNDEELKKLSETIVELKYIQGELEDENQRLKDENNDMKSNEIETVVAATNAELLASEDTMHEESRPRSATLEYEQRFAGVVEEYEAKIEALKTELRSAGQKLMMKEKQVESINSEIEVLRSSLDDETLNVQTLEENLQADRERYTYEVNILKEKLKDATFEKETFSADLEEHLDKKYLNTITNLKEELESSIKDNEKKNRELLQLKKLLEEHQENRKENDAFFYAENSHLIEDNEAKAANLEALSSQNEDLHLEIKRLEDKQSETEERHKSNELGFAETITIKTNKIENLEEQLQLLKAQFLQSEASYKASEISRSGESDSREKEVADLRGQLHSSEEQRLQDQAAHKEEIESLKEINDNKNRELASLNKQLQNFKEQDLKRSAAFKAKKEQLEEEINLKEAEICCLKDEFETFKENQLRKEADQTAMQLNVTGHENSNNQEIQELQYHLHILQQEQKNYESKYLEEQNRLREENNIRFKECTTLREQARQLQEQLGASEAKKISEILKVKQEHLNRVEELENELSSKKKEINELRNLLEDVKSLKCKFESKYSEEQEKRNREQAEKIRSLEDSLQIKSSEVAKLKSSLEDLKFQIRETKFVQTTEQLKEHEVHTVKVRDLETELEKKSIEISCLISMLESEHKSHDRILKETERHLDQIEKTEKEKAHTRIQVGEMKLEIQTIKADLEKERERCHQLALEHGTTKINLDELEEVQKLNRSLNEFEFEKGKLSHELENTKDELKQAQVKYLKLKEKFVLLKGKLQDEQQRYEEKFLSPRTDSGLQTEILQMEEYERMKTESFDAECDKFRLEENLRACEKELTKSKGEVSAFKKANAVLIKQNQVLYLETESLRKGEGLDTKKDLEALEKEKKELQIENEALRFSLKQKERDFDRFDDDLSKTESEEMHGRTENKNKRMKEENAFLMDQNEKLQTQVEEMERELQLVRYHTVFNGNSNINFGNEQRSSTREMVLRESVSPQMQASLTDFSDNAALNITAELQKVMEEQVQMKEQIEQLVAEKENLTSDVRSLKEKRSTNDDKGNNGLKSFQVIEWDKKNTQRQSTQKVNSETVDRPGMESIQRFHNQININETDFRTDSYLSSSYWDALSFLQAVREVNSTN